MSCDRLDADMTDSADSDIDSADSDIDTTDIDAADTAAPLPGSWYRLTTQYTGTRLSLAVLNDNGANSSGKLEMADSRNLNNQKWWLQRNPKSSSTTYALYTSFLGSEKQLDVYSNDKTKPRLAPAGNSSGQIWTIAPWGDGTWQLTNQYSGKELHLGITAGPTFTPWLAKGDDTGQRWVFTPFV